VVDGAAGGPFLYLVESGESEMDASASLKHSQAREESGGGYALLGERVAPTVAGLLYKLERTT